ncbi:MAG: hypothetical protein D5R97_04620 [Candidatus Syntrophonatronum acetioxidans]|uniref:VanZ-like domain-containing protein n=1 Tax=Candidatus Syntrophonatronum acetioxidans TaxID=1795816 RepID=A0A424YF44_9FIRM|nr:MAG: hypothetical protein D5R97_04620 [Candidatus Syntrophonatronum acetioxidans]
MKRKAWFIVLFLLIFLYVLSSIPGLRVLPVINYINSLMVSLDLTVVRLSEWLASQLPLDFGELGPIDTLTEDVLTYVRENPVIIEFFLRKVAHVLVFFVITIALFFLFHQYIRNSTLSVIVSFVVAGLLGYLDEYRQTFVEGRYGSMVDVFINMIGVTLGTCLIIFSLFITRRGREAVFQEKGEKEQKAQEGEEGQSSLPGEGEEKPQAEILVRLSPQEDESGVESGEKTKDKNKDKGTGSP